MLTFEEQRSRAEKIEDEEVKARVLRGLRQLRDIHGESWVEKIDCQTLELSDSSACVLGQVYGDYDDGLDALGLGYEEAPLYGFDHDAIVDYDELDEAWQAVICA